DWYPEFQGFEENRGGCDYGQPPSFFDPYNQPNGKHESLREGIYQLPGRNAGEYLTHREADEAIELITQWKDEPFFIQLSHYAVHTPIQALAEVAAKYEDKPGETQQNAKYAAMVESVDDAMGSLFEVLEEHEINDRTVILFTSDNGGLDRNSSPTDNAPLRSGKGYAYEGGIRVPFIVWHPDRIPAGEVSDTPVSSVDIFPTFLELAGVEPPDDRPIDGLSLVSHLESGGLESLERDELIWHFPHYRHDPGPYSIIRQGNWKLIKLWEGLYELYDLENDLSETTNLAAKHPDKVGELEAALLQQLEESEAKLPILNPDYKD
ncbi:MAG: sulfatase-like hydrolase/transferase, partial [Verrucomicrobiota bacterium]